VYVDSHCHLNYLDSPDDAWARALARGVDGCLCIAVDHAGMNEVLGLARRHARIWATVGEHPANCTGDASWVAQYINSPKVVAIGETGLDYHHCDDSGERMRQRESFEQQLDLAGRHALPVVVHTRAAMQDTLDAIARHGEVVGVLHCFTESWEMAQHALDAGYYISISGIVTFRNAGNVRQVARRIPADRLLVETDAPWLAPVPHRGGNNEPAFVVDTAAYLADLREVELTALAAQTRANFFRLFERAQEPNPSS
jgi:TatD DNase family protein